MSDELIADMTALGDQPVVPRIRLLGRRVLVEPDRRAGHVSGGGLMLVEKWHPPATGIIITVGARLLEDKSPLEAGQRVAFKPYGGTELAWRGQMLRVLEPGDVLGIIGENGELEALA